LLGDVKKRGDPSADFAVRIALGPIGDGEIAPAAVREFQLTVEIDRLACKTMSI